MISLFLLSSLAATDYPPWIWPKGCLPKETNQLDLFCPGAEATPPSAGDDAYRCYNIPNLLRTGNGTLLAFVEGRKLSCKDQGYVDLLLRRSFDNGRTWTHSTLLHGESNSTTHVTIGDAMPVWDARRQQVHLLFTRDNADVFYTRSSDQGASWSTPLNISSQISGHRESGFIGTGHGAGIQTSTGRLLLTLHGPCRTVYSDDAGATWHLGGSTAGGECSVAEAKPGVLVVTSRNGDDAVPRYTYIGVSYDEGLTWNTTANVGLRSPIDGVEASIIAHPNGLLYHSQPDNALVRSNMVLKQSSDLGRTWSNLAHVWSDEAGYSSLVVLGNATDSPLGLLYARNKATNWPLPIFVAKGITFTTVEVAKRSRKA